MLSSYYHEGNNLRNMDNRKIYENEIRRIAQTHIRREIAALR